MSPMSDKAHPPAPFVSSVPPWARTLSRRRFLRIAGGGAGAMTWIAPPGCGYFPAESCPGAYEPWTFPGDEQRPEHLAAGAAILAANPHNSQPWRFVVSAERIELHADVGKSLGAKDGYHREMYLGLGCALENLVLAAAQHGRHADVTLLPAPEDESHAATVELREATPEGRGAGVSAHADARIECQLRAGVRRRAQARHRKYAGPDRRHASRQVAAVRHGV
jgi:hypothetical protein